MTPRLYLLEEYENVSVLLKETLRHDYGAIDGNSYYKECTSRLEGLRLMIDQIEHEEDDRIPGFLAILAGIANRVSLIERSHLGEFSWPFAATIREIANRLLVERNLKRELAPPIMHTIAEGTGYHIRTEQKPEVHASQRIAIVAFPRQLKHHVMMHAIFGHELGHAAFYTNVSGDILRNRVIPALREAGPLQTKDTLTAWLQLGNAPQIIKDRVAKGLPKIQPVQVEQWSLELMCDLFGLLTFGPAFVAAHRTLLEPASRSPNDVDFKNSTHPPLAVRRRTLTDAMRLLGWTKPSIVTPGPAQDAEAAMLAYLLEDDGNPWSQFFDDDRLKKALDHLGSVFDDHPDLRAMPPEAAITEELVMRLSRRLPPILESVDKDGRATQKKMKVDQCLYAGWAYWFGREALGGAHGPLTFLQTNRLCDHALLQQRAIDLSMREMAA